jgi:hypothetical protein
VFILSITHLMIYFISCNSVGLIFFFIFFYFYIHLATASQFFSYIKTLLTFRTVFYLFKFYKHGWDIFLVFSSIQCDSYKILPILLLSVSSHDMGYSRDILYMIRYSSVHCFLIVRH